ncbi:hypothetical protein ACFLYR_02555 [Chloroflexota bacterium]
MASGKMKRLGLPGVALVVLSIIFAGLSLTQPSGRTMSAVDYGPYEPNQSYQSAGEDEYTIMHPSREEMQRWIES